VRCTKGERAEAINQHQVPFRRRRRSRLASSGRHHRSAQTVVGSGCVDHLRWPGASVRSQGSRVWGARRSERRRHGLWREAAFAQRALRQLGAESRDDSRRVTIAGWYAGVEPLGEAEKRAIAEAPAYDDEIRAQLGLAKSEGNGKLLMELINEPSLNINGISSGDVGALARNVIPTTATAVLDLRLVKGNDHRKQVERLIDHIRKQGFYVIDHDPTDAERKQ